MCQGSPAGALGLTAELAQLRHQAVAMIALDLDHPVLDRAACAAKRIFICIWAGAKRGCAFDCRCFFRSALRECSASNAGQAGFD